MAIPHFRAQIITAGRSAVDAAAYRHRTRMVDEAAGSSTKRYDRNDDLVFSEVALPDNAPAWIRDMVHGRRPAQASEAIWNRIQNEERRNGSLAREIIIALPIELSRDENIALMREFVASNITSMGVVADWVYHDAEGNPHVHLMHTERPVEANGFGKKKIAVLDEKGNPLKVNNRIIYNRLIGDRHAFKELRLAWGETANRHLALAGHDARVDMRSFREQGIELTPTTHLGPAGTAVQRKIGESQAWAAREKVRFETADKIMENPGEVLKLVANERSTFSEQDLAKTLHRFIDDPATFANVHAKVMGLPELVTIRGNIIDPESGRQLTQPVYSTRNAVRVEYDMAIAADRLGETGGFGVAAKIVADAIRSVETRDPSRSFRFDPEQVAAVEHVTANKGIAAVVGYAGAGKSTLLEAANAAWVADGRRVFGAALAGKAAEGLEDSAGIASRTLASWELSWKNGRDLLQAGDVFVIDEAGMVASNQLSRFITTIEQAGAKAVLVGDAMQLQPIEAGAAFRAITERAGYVELVGIRRQTEQWGQEASRQFARGQVGDALDAYRSRGHIVDAADKAQAIEKIVSDWSQARASVAATFDAMAKAQSGGTSIKGDELLVLAHTNADVLALNTGIRQVMKAQGALSDEQAFVTERGTRQFAVGDRAIFLKNEKFEERLAPELGRQQVKNGMLGTVIATSGDNGEHLLRVRLDNGREVAFNPETYRNVDHGYAATIHKSQGVTVDRVFVMASKSMDQHLSYVAMSRHRLSVTLYAPKTEFGSFEALADTLGKSGAKSTTLDFANESGYRAVVDAFAERRGIETLASIAPAFTAFVDRQRAWIEEKREQVTALWARAEQVFGRSHDRELKQDVPVVGVPQPVVQIERAGIGFAAVTRFARSIETDAHQRLISSPDWQHRVVQMQSVLDRTYRNPAEALSAIATAASDMKLDGRELGKMLAEKPQAFGSLRGGESIVAGRDQRNERSTAVASSSELAIHGRSLAQSYRRNQPAAISTEAGHRVAMQIAIPELSGVARQRLAEIEAIRTAGSLDAYRDATRIVMKEPAVARELATVASAIADRFGSKAFTDRADEADRAKAFARVGADEQAQLEKVSTDYAAIRRFAGELAFVEKMTAVREPVPAKTVAADVPAQELPAVAAAQPAVVAKQGVTDPGEQTARPPLFAAVTSFANGIEEAARETTRTSPTYRNQIDALYAVADKIWQEPQKACEKIERSLAGATEPGKLEALLKEDPSRAGALRGSDKLLDRFSAAGAERKQAVQALPSALAAVRASESVYRNVLDNELRNEKASRERMGVEIPALSRAAQSGLDQLVRTQGHQELSKAVLALPAEVKTELSDLNRALNMRFGPDAFINNHPDLARKVAPAERAGFEQMRTAMKTVQQAVETDIGQRHQSERIRKALEQGSGITR